MAKKSIRRKHYIPWIHRWSRLLIAAISIVGAVTTAALTTGNTSGGTLSCPTIGCDWVLSNPDATVFHLSLTLFGCFAYVSLAVLAVAPLLVDSAKHNDLRSNLENWTWLVLLAGAAAMLVFSSYLIYLLIFKLKAICIYCIASALFSISLFILTLIGLDWENFWQVFLTVTVVGLFAIVGTLEIYTNVNQLFIEDHLGSEGGHPITTTSGTAEMALGQHLKQAGAKMYAAFWSPQSYHQKQLFGQQAFSQVNYIECDPKGQDPQTDQCIAAKIFSFPTWKINGKFYEGEKTLPELADLSGYQGLRNFQNSSLLDY